MKYALKLFSSLAITVFIFATGVQGNSLISPSVTVSDSTTLISPSNNAINVPLNVTLKWNPVSTVKKYLVECDSIVFVSSGVMEFSLVAADSLNLNNLHPLTKYCWAVSTDTNGVNSWSTTDTFTTTGSVMLSSPSNGSTIDITPIMLSWSSVSGATALSYLVQVSTSSSFLNTIISQPDANTTFQTTSNIPYNPAYYWRVKASTSTATTPWSNIWSFNAIMPLPTTPTILSPANGSINQPTALTLSWLSSSYASWYDVQIYGKGSTFLSQPGITQLFLPVSGLANGTTYTWSVTAYDSAGWSPGYPVDSFTTIPNVPAVPLLSSPPNNSPSQPTALTLVWASVTGATSYSMQIATTSSFSNNVLSQSGLTTLSIGLNSLGNNITYYWEVNAKNVAGISPWSSIWSFKTTLSPPATPILAFPTNSSTGLPVSTTLNWGSANGALSYGVQITTVLSFANTISSQSGITALSLGINALGNSTIYYWRANAANSGGNSAWSNVWSFTTIIASPGSPSLVSPSNGAIVRTIPVTLAWGSVTGAANYSIQVSTASNFASTAFSQISLTSGFTNVGNLSNSNTYYWRAYATNAAGSGPWSSIWSFTIGTSAVLPISPQIHSGNEVRAVASASVLHYFLLVPCFVSLKYYDLNGRFISNFINQRQAAGNHSFSLPTSRITKGAYIQVFEAESIITKDKIFLIR